MDDAYPTGQPTAPSTQTLPSSTPISPCDEKTNYAPNNPDHTPLKIIKVRFHVLRDASGNGNFSNADAIQYISDLLDHNQYGTNHYLQNIQSMNLPMGNSTPTLTDSRIRYELTPAANDPNDTDQDGICFHNSASHYYLAPDMGSNNSLYPGGTVIYSQSSSDFSRYNTFGDQSGNVVNIYMPALHPEYVQEIMNGNQTVSTTGWAEWYGENNLVLIGAYERFQNLDNHPIQGSFPGTYFTGWYYGFGLSSFAKLLNHEMGHILGLRHSWSFSDDYFGGLDCGDSPLNPNLYNSANHSHSNNMMDYNADQDALTPCQLGIIHYNLMHRPNYYYNKLKKDYCAVDPSKNISINTGQNIVWSSSKFLKGNLIIENGATLTIKCYVGMPTSGMITVNVGGKLIVDGGIITGNCDGIWIGIEVLGDPNQQHSISATTNGVCIIQNGSLIENAYNAIYTGVFNDPSQNGGLIQVSNSTFLNNRISINIPAYGDLVGYITNKSTISNTLFDCNAGLHGGNGINHHVALVETHGVGIYDNIFKNSAPNGAFSDDFRGRGINCINSTLLVDANYDFGNIQAPCDLPDGPGNTFDNLNVGIVIYDYLPLLTSKTDKIMESKFVNCKTGIIVKSAGMTKIYNNEFERNDNLVSDGIYLNQWEFGISSTNATNILTYENFFLTNSLPSTPFYTALRYDNTFGANSYVYKNGFSNTSSLMPLNTGSRQVTANEFYNDNSLVNLRCNSYAGFNIDWLNANQFSDQGNPTVGTNLFSDNSLGMAYVVNIVNNSVFHYSHYYDPMNLSAPTLQGMITVVVGGSSDVCQATNPCAIRSNAFTPPGSQEPGSVGGEGDAQVPKRKSFIEEGVFTNIQKEDYEMATREVQNIQEDDRRMLNNWYVDIKKNKIDFMNLRTSDINFLLKYACLGTESGQFAKSILEGFTSTQFDCRNIENGSESKETSQRLNSLYTRDFSIYPNPSSGLFRIKFGVLPDEMGQLNITNVLGQNVSTVVLDPNIAEYTFNGSALKSGTYYVTLKTNSGLLTSKKLIVIN